MKKKQITLLVFTSDPARVEWVNLLLNQYGKYQLVSESNVHNISHAISGHTVSCMIFDYCQADACALLSSIDFETIDVPLILLVSGDQKTSAVKAISQKKIHYISARDCSPQMLDHTIQSAIERHTVVRDLGNRIHDFQANEARLLNLIVDNVDGIVVVDIDRKIRFNNPAAGSILKDSLLSFIERKFSPDHFSEWPVEYVLEENQDSPIVVEMRTVGTTWEGEPAFLISLHDITARKKAEDALRESEERYELAVTGSKDGLWDWDLRSNTIYFANQWKALLGYAENEIGGTIFEWYSRIVPEDLADVKSGLSEHIEGKIPCFEKEYRMFHKDGTMRWMLCRGAAIRDESGKAYRIAGSHSDITERKTAETHLYKALDDLKFALASEKVLIDELDKKNKELVELSITDGLTGLFNHRFIQERFDFEFKRVKRYGGFLSCMIIDIDHFKNINDTYGHQIGDFVLRELGLIITTLSREVDICGRYGGEEFMTLSNVPLEEAMKYATKLHTAIEGRLFTIKGHSIKITVSIGIADFRTDIKTKQEMIERSDMAMYQAKQDGRNLIRIWKEQQHQDEVALDRFSIDDLKRKFIDLSHQVRASYMESTEALVRAIDAKDHYTQEHSQNVARYAVEIAQELGLVPEDVEIIKYAALLHDVGKIGIGSEVLVKTHALTPEEFDTLKKHPIIGVNILKDVKFLEKEIPIILHHHERYDGNGYPHGLKGREIPLGARILGVADAFDAMTTDRGYKKKLTLDEALEELKRGKGTQFAEEIVDVFIKILRASALKEPL